MSGQSYTPEDVLRLTAPTKEFLCSLDANTYGIKFLRFSIADYESKRKFFKIGKDDARSAIPGSSFTLDRESKYRTIRYDFSEDVLRLPSIVTKLKFSVGNEEIRGLRMIERHYFRDKIIKSFDFTFGFCIPGSVNTWETIYSVPPLDEELIRNIVLHPYATSSDSFYFVGSKMIMHNKAEYKYIAEDVAQSKRSYDDADDYGGTKTMKLNEHSEPKSAKYCASKAVTWSKEHDYE
ncbi:unnamed protein product [Albugo candida]|uniref:GMP phosphodiesterase delta subunit domain-containing protein n=1 Tax=Albugo candida TaxID=65357 RepID=A0A024GVG2_9STRA|nr:unnamed protein product [Albugo candida]|eukprot:CCI50605.1 unnamed protein product [Albugo candida]